MKELFQKHRKRIIGGVIAICILGGGGYTMFTLIIVHRLNKNIQPEGLKRSM